MELTTQAALIVAGIVFFLAGVFGIRVRFGSAEIPTHTGWYKGILIVTGGLLIVLGVVLEPDSWELWTRLREPGAAPVALNVTPIDAPAYTPSVLPPTQQIIASLPTNIPAALPAPCPGFVSRALVEEWSVVGQTSDKNRVNDYLPKFHKVFAESTANPVYFRGGDTLPAGRIIATDFGGMGETDVWKNYPLKSVAHYRSWGLFETTSDFHVPASGGGQCLVIVP